MHILHERARSGRWTKIVAKFHNERHTCCHHHNLPQESGSTRLPLRNSSNNDADNMSDAVTDHDEAPRTTRHPPFLSSSMCDMFQTRSHHQSDACALACCGIWLWERNQYMMDGTIPKSYKERPLVLAVAVVFVGGVVLISTSRIGDVLPDDVVAYVQLGLCVAVAVLLCGFRNARYASRRQLATLHYTMFEMTDDSRSGLGAADATELTQMDLLNDRPYHVFLHRHKQQITGDHACCSCYKNDHASFPGRDLSKDRVHHDFCAKLWRLLASMCCDACCSCWCMCYGICSTAQEHRHLVAMVDTAESTFVERSMWRRDYITFQPWEEYIPAIQQIRDMCEHSLVSHMSAMSTLSRRLLAAVFAIVAFVLIWTLLPFTTVQFWQFLILIATLLQPIVILYFVYWAGNRFDISMDAIVKYFASGFVICTSMALVYEVAVSTALSVILIVTEIIGAAFFEDDTGNALDGSAVTGISEDIDKDDDGFIIFQKILWAFLNSFLVAALVEEMAKHLCFWMVEHPDLQDVFDANTMRRKSATVLFEGTDRNTNETDKPATTPEPESLNRVSKGAAITIAMVTVALGFACSENLMYIFVYTPPGASSEISTLVARSILPLHPVCAAIQSIGVCRRELEDTSKHRATMDFGSILLPAWFIHGLYDFVLFVLAAVYGDGGDGKNDDALDDDSAPPAFSIAMGIFLAGLAYYQIFASAQQRRLEQKDAGSNIVNEPTATTLSNQVV